MRRVWIFGGSLAVAVVLPPLAASLQAGRSPALLVNETPSVPRGLYARSRDPEPRPGRVVAIAQPPQARRYLAGLGVAPNLRLLKRVAARGGAQVCTDGAGLFVDGAGVPVLRTDRRGIALPAWRGCRRLAADELLLLGDTPTSFDSRYFGPVRRADVEAAYSEVLRW